LNSFIHYFLLEFSLLLNFFWDHKFFQVFLLDSNFYLKWRQGSFLNNELRFFNSLDWLFSLRVWCSFKIIIKHNMRFLSFFFQFSFTWLHFLFYKHYDIILILEHHGVEIWSARVSELTSRNRHDASHLKHNMVWHDVVIAFIFNSGCEISPFYKGL